MPRDRRHCSKAQDPLIPYHQIGGDGQSAEESFDELWDLHAELYGVSFPEDIATLRRQGGKMHEWRLDNIVCYDLVLPPVTLSRSEKQIGRATGPFVQVAVGDADPWTASFGGEVHTDVEDGPLLYDFARPMTETVSPSWTFGCIIPHSAIGYDPAIHDPLIVLDDGHPAGRVLRDTLLALNASLSDIRQSDAAGLANGLCGLVSALMLNGGQRGDAERAIKISRTKVMRDYIEANLRDPDLNLNGVSSAVGASRSTIYRDFAEEGGLDRYIQRRRLHRVYQDLADLPPARGLITRVAEHWGFQSQSHFYRQFRAEFGCVPGDIVGQAPIEGRQRPGSVGPGVISWLHEF